VKTANGRKSEKWRNSVISCIGSRNTKFAMIDGAVAFCGDLPEFVLLRE